MASHADVLDLVTRSLEKLDVDEFYAQLAKLGTVQETSSVLAEVFWVLWLKHDAAGGEKKSRLIELMKSCVKDRKIDRRTAMEVLDVDCMVAAGLVPDQDWWRKKEIRHNTKAMYTVTKYNLLREDSEGYAKLVVALNHFGDATLQPHMIPALYHEIQSLIGYFDLDPNRVLDLVLEAAELQPRNRAYLALVPLFKKDAVVHLLGFKFQHHQKPGAPAMGSNLPLLAAALIAEGLVEMDALLGHLAPGDDEIRKAQEQALQELKKEVDSIGVINLNANDSSKAGGGGGDAGGDAGAPLRTLGLGFATVDKPSAQPQQPPPTGLGGGGGGVIASIRDAQQRGLMSQGGGGAPYGMMGGGMGGGGGGYISELRDLDRGGAGLGNSGGFRPAGQLKADTLSLDPAIKYEGLLLPKDAGANQKLALAQALLQVGAYEPATLLLARLTSLGMQPAAWQPLGTTLADTVLEELQPVLRALAPRGLAGQGLLDAAVLALAKVGAAGGGSAALRATLPAALPPGPPLSARAGEALLTLGPFLCRSPKLLNQVIQAVRHHYLLYCIPASGAEDAAAQAQAARVEELVGRVLLPASCLVPAMPALAHELWQLLRLLPFGTRFRLYAELKEQSERHPYLSAACKLAVHETRKVLKRLHAPPDKRERKDSCKPHGRLLAKIAAANPLPVLDVVLNTVEAYVNQLDPVVEALKYLTPLGYDVLTFVVLMHLSLDRQKVKDDGINISDWLQSLAKFSGAVCRKYPDVDIFALCQFLANALRGADSFDLLVLKELVETLTGISVPLDPSPEQLEGRLGGEALSGLVSIKDVDKSRKAWARGGKRLLEALQRGPKSQHLALPLFILVAQQRQAIMMHTQAQHIKFMVELYDTRHDTCQQYIEFLQSALSYEDYKALIPSIKELRLTYNIEPEIAFLAHRPMLQQLLRDLQQASLSEEGEIEGPGDGAGEVEPGQVQQTPPPAGDGGGAGGTPSSGAKAPLGATAAKAHAAWQAVVDEVRETMPNPGVWSALTPELYTLFWTLTVHDLYVPTAAYESELTKVKLELREVDAKFNDARNAPPNSMAALPEDELLELGKQRERLKGLVSKLPQELQAQTQRVQQIRAFFTREPQRLQTQEIETSKICPALVGHCVLPRLLCGPTDASYCTKFCELLHSLEVKGFSTVWYLNQLIKDVVPVLRCLTDREAVCLGILLHDTLLLINRWRSDEQLYEAEAKSKSGFSVSLKQADAAKRTPYPQYKALAHRWHNTTANMIKSCLESSEYTSRRNALTTLQRLLPVFPVAESHVQQLRKTVDKVRVAEEREDLQVLLKSYSAALTAELGQPGRVITDEAFGQQAPSKGKRSAAAGAASRGTKATGSAASAGNKTTAAAAGGNAAGGGGGAKATTSSTTAAAGATGGKTAVPSRLRPDAPEFRSPSKVGGGGGGAAGSPARAPAGGEGEDGSRASKRLKLEEGNGNDNHHSSKARGGANGVADEGGGRTAQAVGGSGAIKRDLSSTALPDQGAGSKRVRTQDAPDVSKAGGEAGGRRDKEGRSERGEREGDGPGTRLSGGDRDREARGGAEEPGEVPRDKAAGGGKGERERERDKGDREHREGKDKERERDKSRDKEREKDKERDKDKEREKDKHRDKEREGGGGGGGKDRHKDKEREGRSSEHRHASTSKEPVRGDETPQTGAGAAPAASGRGKHQDGPAGAGGGEGGAPAPGASLRRERSHEPIVAPAAREPKDGGGKRKHRDKEGGVASEAASPEQHRERASGAAAPRLSRLESGASDQDAGGAGAGKGGRRGADPGSPPGAGTGARAGGRSRR